MSRPSLIQLVKFPIGESHEPSFSFAQTEDIFSICGAYVALGLACSGSRMELKHNAMSQVKVNSADLFIAGSIRSSNSIATPKEYNLKRHYETNHRSYDKYDGPVRVSRLKQLKANLRLQQTCFTKIEKANVASVTASYELSRMIAMSAKSYSEGDFIKQCLLKTAQILCPEKTDLFRDISLSRNTIAERIDEMAGDLKQQLNATSSRFEHFSIAIDETVDITGIAQLAVFIRACDNEFNIYEELIELIPMHDTTTSQDIFDKVEQVLRDCGLDLSKLACLLPTALRIWLADIMVLPPCYEQK
ncbi:hypothetical protein M513_04386 [Trichuris suis]|uniref:DUF4371 domain-containing protein n=1 Tax=Trichuris suis TaxID=68888 RepID=A0A085MBU0_9BILA|nr:hypothetical protein M513_04386 [Trichuris suis]